MAIFNLNVNGKQQQVDVDPNTPMLWVLRDHLNLTGTKFAVVLRCAELVPSMSMAWLLAPVSFPYR